MLADEISTIRGGVRGCEDERLAQEEVCEVLRARTAVPRLCASVLLLSGVTELRGAWWDSTAPR